MSDWWHSWFASPCIIDKNNVSFAACDWRNSWFFCSMWLTKFTIFFCNRLTKFATFSATDWWNSQSFLKTIDEICDFFSDSLMKFGTYSCFFNDYLAKLTCIFQQPINEIHYFSWWAIDGFHDSFRGRLMASSISFPPHYHENIDYFPESNWLFSPPHKRLTKFMIIFTWLTKFLIFSSDRLTKFTIFSPWAIDGFPNFFPAYNWQK